MTSKTKKKSDKNLSGIIKYKQKQTIKIVAYINMIKRSKKNIMKIEICQVHFISIDFFCTKFS